MDARTATDQSEFAASAEQTTHTKQIFKAKKNGALKAPF
jgi:hypothetical protein